MAIKKLFFTFITVSCLLSDIIFVARATRELRRTIVDPVVRDTAAAGSGGGRPGQGSLVECWNAVLELRSCADEIVVFFLNGAMTATTANGLDNDCCRAIGFITHECWPAMLASLGFTAEEGSVLREYCDYHAPTVALAPAPEPEPSASSSVAATSASYVVG